MKKALALILAVIMILSMGACAGTSDASTEQNPGDGTQQGAENTPADPASEGITLSEYLKNESDTPLVFFAATDRTPETVPTRVYAFRNGKVKVIPNVGGYSFGDFAKMTDAEVLQSVEQAFETFLRRYVEEWQPAMDEAKAWKGGDKPQAYLKYLIFTWMLRPEHDTAATFDSFAYSNAGEMLYEAITAKMQSLNERHGDVSLYFHPTKYYLPDYVDYAFNIASDESGNKIEDVYLTYNVEKYFDGDLLAAYDCNRETYWEDLPDANVSYYNFACWFNDKVGVTWPSSDYISKPFESIGSSSMKMYSCLIFDDICIEDTFIDQSGTSRVRAAFYGLSLFDEQPEYNADTFSVNDSTFYSISSRYTFCTRDENVQNVTFEYVKGEPIDDSKVGGNVLLDALANEIWNVFQKKD